jgi:MoaA/NifB/PqqE/SkfB family radical SAM enzyme
METNTEEKKAGPVYSPIISGRRKNLVVARMWIWVGLRLMYKFPNPLNYFKALKRAVHLKNRLTINKSVQKLAHVDGRYYFNINHSGWPSKHFQRLFEREGRLLSGESLLPLENLQMVLLAITKKCPMACEHCYEWSELNKKETLTLHVLKKILEKFQSGGVSHFQFGGGEPLSRIKDLLELLRTADKSADFWVTTSGFNLTKENALLLKEAGLTGVAISLDHYDPSAHNKFRGHPDSFRLVTEAIRNARESKLVVALSVCVSREFCKREHLLRYMELAKNSGASFVQLLEPRAAGHYAGKDVLLTPDNEKTLEDFFLEMNRSRKFRDMPIVVYYGYRQRRIGCAGAGYRYLYVDTDGYMNTCPFCRHRTTHVLDGDPNVSISRMKEAGCAKFALIGQGVRNEKGLTTTF